MFHRFDIAARALGKGPETSILGVMSDNCGLALGTQLTDKAINQPRQPSSRTFHDGIQIEQIDSRICGAKRGRPPIKTMDLRVIYASSVLVGQTIPTKLTPTKRHR